MRSEKTVLVNYIGDLIENSAFLYFVSYKGLTVDKFSDLACGKFHVKSFFNARVKIKEKLNVNGGINNG